MSKKSDTTVFHGVTLPKPDLEPEPKRLKSQLELVSEQEPKLPSETYDSISEESDEEESDEEESDEHMTLKELYGDLNSEDSDSSEDERDGRYTTKADDRYLELSSILSDYDAIPPPIHSYLCGGAPILPLRITKRLRPILKKFSEIALAHYQHLEGSGANFEFHQLVKCTFWANPRRNVNKVVTNDNEGGSGSGYRPNTTVYYITFQAKAKGDPSNSPAITIFQAKVSVDKVHKDNQPVVKECRIKNPWFWLS